MASWLAVVVSVASGVLITLVGVVTGWRDRKSVTAAAVGA
jgi:hypothetical protein